MGVVLTTDHRRGKCGEKWSGGGQRRMGWREKLLVPHAAPWSGPSVASANLPFSSDPLRASSANSCRPQNRWEGTWPAPGIMVLWKKIFTLLPKWDQAEPDLPCLWEEMVQDPHLVIYSCKLRIVDSVFLSQTGDYPYSNLGPSSQCKPTRPRWCSYCHHMHSSDLVVLAAYN